MLSDAYLADLVFGWSHILHFKDAGLAKDQICQVWFLYKHQGFKFYEKLPHLMAKSYLDPHLRTLEH